MLLWYAKFICQQPAQPCFYGFIKVSAQSDCRWRGRLPGIQLDLHLQVCADGFGFFQDICFCLLPYDSGDGAQANILPSQGGILCFSKVLIFLCLPFRKAQP